MTQQKFDLHPRNRHKGSYNFQELIRSCPSLAKFVKPNPYGNESIDFANPLAVKTLNKAILKSSYNLTWDLPDNFLCPPIPSRADYIHIVADILASSNKGVIPQGEKVTVLDIGVGANCIYPLLGHREYGWSFIGTEIDQTAIANANKLIEQNGFNDAIEIRWQKSNSLIFENILSNDRSPFDIAMCNPPFHSSMVEATAGTKRKWKNLNIKTGSLNFGGQSNELWCPGGEVAFIKRIILESGNVNCKWFTALVSKGDNLASIYNALEKVKPSQVKTIEMGQGQKKSRIVAWSFLNF